MLLSEILLLSRELHNIPLNESILSNKLYKLFKPLEPSNLSLEYITTDYTNKAPSFFHVVFEYEYLAKHGELTSFLCDTEEGRRSILKCNYKKRTKNKYSPKNFIVTLIDTLQQKFDYNIGISDIIDSDIIQINPEDAKKKIYKTGLQFWLDYADELVAVTIDNKIVLYIDKLNEYDSWLDVNPKYNEETDFSDFATNSDKVEEYVKKAFRIIPSYNVYTNTADIKKLLGADNIKTLLNLTRIFSVYVVNPSKIDSYDITDKLKTRQDYKKFLYNYLNMAKENIAKYKITIQKKQLNVDNIQNKLFNYMDVCMDTIMELQLFEIDTISKLSQDLFYIKHYTAPKIDSTYSTRLKLTLGDYVVTDISNKINGYKQNYTIFYIANVGSCFILLNIMLELCIEKIKNTLQRYDTYYEQASKENITYELLKTELMYLKIYYNTLKTFIKAELNKEPIKDVLNVLSSKNIDPLYIFNNLINFNWN